ncbi:MAG: hypothetical protein GC181_08895 [Bacteroidetes bacterium]|nr:hypothetical protein [Bacteroidota bacterium]
MTRFRIECKPEEILLKNLNISPSEITHHSGSGSVCKFLQNSENSIGLIDQDPSRTTQHPYFRKLFNSNVSDEFDIRFGFDPDKNNGLIILKPFFESWIINAATLSKVDMADFALSADPTELHSEILFKIGKLQSLIHQLIKRKNKGILRILELLTT